MKPVDLSDRRRLPRAAAFPATAIVFARNTVHVRCSIENLSAGGAQLLGELQLTPGERVQIQLELNIDHVLTFAAEVVRCVPEPGDRYRSAVAFCDLPLEIEDRVQRLVLAAIERRRASTDPAVLLLDDDPDVRATLGRDLGALGRQVIAATTPLDLVRALQDPARRFDAALVDFCLGASDGIDVLAYLRDEYPSIRRVLISGSIAADVRDRALRSGDAHAFLAKPWTREALGDVLGAEATTPR